MLRLAVIALLLANAGYYAYTQGWLRSATAHAERAGIPAQAIFFITSIIVGVSCLNSSALYDAQ